MNNGMNTGRDTETERVLSELNRAVAEEAIASSIETRPRLSDRRRNERRGVIPDRRLRDRRGK
jgi:hypothetical protein